MRKKVNFGQIIFASFLGIASGVYIFNPIYFVRYSQTELEKREALEEKTKND